MPANGLKGQVAFEVEGEAYTLVFDYNTLCTLETRLDQLAPQIIEEIQTKPLTAGRLRTLLWAALEEFHPKLSERDVGRLIQALSYDAARDKLIEAIQLGFPSKEDANGASDPQPAAAKARRGASQATTQPGAD